MSDIEKLHTSGLADYHCHCDYSKDAEGTIDEYCEAAVRRGLSEICFTTHYDANPNSDGRANFIRVNGENKPVHPDLLEPYIEDVHRAAERFLSRGLIVKTGVEFGWYPDCEETVRALKDRYSFDHLLCGIHEINDRCFCCNYSYEKLFSSMSADDMVAKYFDQATAAARSGLFDAIAHLDYYRKYGEEYYGRDRLQSAHEPHLAEFFEALKQTDTALEINTAGLRKGLDSHFPSPGLVNAAKKAGVRIQFLGSDAHRPQDVGFDFDVAASLIPDYLGACEV